MFNRLLKSLKNVRTEKAVTYRNILVSAKNNKYGPLRINLKKFKNSSAAINVIYKTDKQRCYKAFDYIVKHHLKTDTRLLSKFIVNFAANNDFKKIFKFFTIYQGGPYYLEIIKALDGKIIIDILFNFSKFEWKEGKYSRFYESLVKYLNNYMYFTPVEILYLIKFRNDALEERSKGYSEKKLRVFESHIKTIVDSQYIKIKLLEDKFSFKNYKETAMKMQRIEGFFSLALELIIGKAKYYYEEMDFKFNFTHVMILFAIGEDKLAIEKMDALKYEDMHRHLTSKEFNSPSIQKLLKSVIAVKGGNIKQDIFVVLFALKKFKILLGILRKIKAEGKGSLSKLVSNLIGFISITDIDYKEIKDILIDMYGKEFETSNLFYFVARKKVEFETSQEFDKIFTNGRRYLEKISTIFSRNSQYKFFFDNIYEGFKRHKNIKEYASGFGRAMREEEEILFYFICRLLKIGSEEVKDVLKDYIEKYAIKSDAMKFAYHNYQKFKDRLIEIFENIFIEQPPTEYQGKEFIKKALYDVLNIKVGGDVLPDLAIDEDGDFFWDDSGEVGDDDGDFFLDDSGEVGHDEADFDEPNYDDSGEG